MNGWKKISSAPKDGSHFDIWMAYASPRSMGMADAFMIPDCWYLPNGNLVHMFRGMPTQLDTSYVQHWAPVGKKHKAGPKDEHMDVWHA